MIKNWFKKVFKEDGGVSELKSVIDEVGKAIDEKIDRSFNVKLLESMQKLEIKDGDVLVVKHHYKLNEADIVNFRDAIKGVLSRFGLNVNVMLLEHGMEIGVLEKASETEDMIARGIILQPVDFTPKDAKPPEEE